ncbi:unnamed protein product [Tuber aestivum]|uniref:Uncharacterized protein n=1 Tax=Tuber aestivum TaxID=59557 RepID=A0A292PN83_9PEZI|nr:unnamed protein product [Tuber aestivum]
MEAVSAVSFVDFVPMYLSVAIQVEEVWVGCFCGAPLEGGELIATIWGQRSRRGRGMQARTLIGAVALTAVLELRPSCTSPRIFSWFKLPTQGRLLLGAYAADPEGLRSRSGSEASFAVIAGLFAVIYLRGYKVVQKGATSASAEAVLQTASPVLDDIGC